MSSLAVRSRVVARALLSTLRSRGKAGTPVRRLLVAHYLLLGDTVLLAPLLKTLAHRYPDAERILLARPAVASLFEGRPYGATVLPFDRRDTAGLARVVDSGPYDLAFVPDDNRYAWLARAAGARRVIGFSNDRPAWKNWMLDRAVPYPSRPGAWADLVARHLRDDDGSDDRDDDPPPFVRGEWPAPACADFELPPAPYVVLHIGASTPLKQWPADRWRALADRIAAAGLRVVWSGGADERTLLAPVGPGVDEIDLVGRLDLAQLWRLLANARLLLCPDTGIAHLARVAGVATVALFGPGSAVVHGAGRFWRGAAFEAVTIDEMPCRNQRTLYRRDIAWVRRCGRGFRAGAEPAGRGDPDLCGRALCMEAIDGAVTVDAVARLLG